MPTPADPPTASRPPRFATQPREGSAAVDASTPERLVEAAERLFGTQGYWATPLRCVAVEAGVTRGALYHHFLDKRALFEAVYVHMERRLRDAALRAYRATDSSHDALEAALRAYLDGLLEPGVQRIALVEAVPVLGITRLRELTHEITLRLLEDALRGRPRRSRALAEDTGARLMFGALAEASWFVAHARDPAGAASEMLPLLLALYRGLDSPPQDQPAVAEPAAPAARRESWT